MTADEQLVKELEKAELRYVTDSTPGITRKRQGKEFTYTDSSGRRITAEATLSRIQNLVIPPAWENVWICPSPSGYMQATGIDDKGRKQYIYHADWTKLSQENKFNKMISFGEILPKIRRKIRTDMDNDELSKEKITATVVWLLEHTLIRIGNEEYAKTNDSFGLTTLRNKHVKIKGKEVVFEFKGKSGVQHTVSISHPKIAKILKECIELPGYEIFQYLNGSDKFTLDSASVNEYLKEVTDMDISAKEFRTWGGTVLGGETLFNIGKADDEKSVKKNIATAVKKVSSYLRNTTSVCRTYYIHPTILDTYEKNLLVPHFEKIYAEFDRNITQLTRPEYATLTLLKKYS